jgi:uncharacterized protein (TIGR01244 family)
MNETATQAVPVEGISGVTPLTRSGRVYFAGQPSAEAIHDLAHSEDVKVLVSFRNPQEMIEAGVDTQGACESCGVRFVNIPFGQSFTSAEVDQLADVLDAAEGNIALHCGTSNRVGMIWAAYLATKKGVPAEEAIRIGQSAGMTMPALEKFVRKYLSV